MDLQNIQVVLLDIEGTVCPISFVKDVLFPYALDVLPSTLAQKWDDLSFTPYRDAFPAEHKSSPQALEAHVRDLMSQDLKIPYLKSLQGYLWLSGYQSGELKCPLFPDVAKSMKSWKTDGKTMIIYSSGSVPAQKLLFQYTNAQPDGDLRGLITDYFDTTNAGLKQESGSYEKIAASYPQYAARNWLFLSDNVREIEACKKAGMNGVVVVREGNAELTKEEVEGNLLVRSFEQLRLA